MIAGHDGGTVPNYGSLFRPTNYGAPGCRGDSSGGAGGGLISIGVGDQLYLDGVIESSGGDAPSGSNAGGGSGGSMLISCGRFSGHGLVSSNGGSGDGSTSGGGAGGRIAIYSETMNKYSGAYTSVGGDAGNGANDMKGYAGGPGTIYIQDSVNQYPRRMLRLDNKGRPWDSYVTLNENMTSYVFDELHLVRSASVHLVPDGTARRLVVHKIVGDRSGLIHIHSNQTLQAEYQDATYTITRTATNYKLDPGSVVLMSTSVHVVGLGSVAFDWNGRLVNVQHFHVAFGRKVHIGPDAHTASFQNGNYISVDKPGTLRFSTLEFGSGTVIHYPPRMGVHFIVSLLVSEKPQSNFATQGRLPVCKRIK